MVRFGTINIIGLLLIGFDVALTRVCEPGWTRYGDTCYYVDTGLLPGRAKSWHSARSYCQRYQADLAYPKTVEESQLLYNLSKSDISGLHGSLWLGVSSRENYDEWKFTDGSTFSKDSSEWGNLWATNQPEDDRLKLCGYQYHRTFDKCFTRVEGMEYITKVMNSPHDADNKNTFRLAMYWSPSETDCEACERLCIEKPNCELYTYFTQYYGDATWKHFCIGRSNNFTGGFNGVSHPHTCSGSVVPKCPVDGDWYSDNCGLKMGFACQKNINATWPVEPPPSAVPGYCPKGYISYDQKCFLIREHTPGPSPGVDGFEWSQALQECQNLDVEGIGLRPTLASFHTEREYAAVAMHLHDEMFGLWIGLYRPPLETEWVWADNSEFVLNKYPKTLQMSGILACAHTSMAPDPMGQWGLGWCDKKLGYVCQFEKDPRYFIPTPDPVDSTPSYPGCTSGQVAYRKACYEVLDKNIPWADAEQECQKINGHLASIADGSENAALTYHFSVSPDYGAVWMGFNRNDDGEWLWSDNHPVTYTNWHAGFPATINSTCAMFVTSTGLWQTFYCDTDSFKPLCKIDYAPLPTHPTPVDGYCPHQEDGWKPFGDSCYMFARDLKTFEEANDACKAASFDADDGKRVEVNMVSIHSLEENQFVFNEFKAHYQYAVWLGRHIPEPGRPYEWTDGTPDGFMKYLPGEPDTADGAALCTRMSTQYSASIGYWHAAPCTAKQHFACKTPKIPKSTTVPPTTTTTRATVTTSRRTVFTTTTSRPTPSIATAPTTTTTVRTTTTNISPSTSKTPTTPASSITSPGPTGDPVAEAQKGGLSGGSTAGIIIGVFVGVAALVAVGWFLWRKFRPRLPDYRTGGSEQAPTAFDNPMQYSSMQE